MTRIGGKKRAWRSDSRVEDEGLREALGALGKRVVALRKEAGLTQEALASAASLDTRHVQDIEYGKVNVTFATLRAIARALETTILEMVREVS